MEACGHVPSLGERPWLLMGLGTQPQTLRSLDAQLVSEAQRSCFSQAHCCPRSCGPAVQGKSSKQALTRTRCCALLSSIHACPSGQCLQLREYSKRRHCFHVWETSSFASCKHPDSGQGTTLQIKKMPHPREVNRMNRSNNVRVPISGLLLFLPHPQTSHVLSIPSVRTVVRGTAPSPPGWAIMVRSPASSLPLPLNSSPATGDLLSSFKEGSGPTVSLPSFAIDRFRVPGKASGPRG